MINSSRFQFQSEVEWTDLPPKWLEYAPPQIIIQQEGFSFIASFTTDRIRLSEGRRFASSSIENRTSHVFTVMFGTLDAHATYHIGPNQTLEAQVFQSNKFCIIRHQPDFKSTLTPLTGAVQKESSSVTPLILKLLFGLACLFMGYKGWSKWKTWAYPLPPSFAHRWAEAR